jgi:tetratricopeptide (TPR) repeat protein
MEQTTNLIGALRAKRLVGRTKEIETIQDAIRAVGDLRVIYLEGAGGIGKTRLLEHIAEMVAEMARRGIPCRHIGPFDFYLTALQSIAGLEAALVQQLDPQGHGFAAYRQACQQEREHASSGDQRKIKELRQATERAFAEGFNEVTATTRLVLTFDTLEVLQYESDAVQEMCGIELTGLEVKGWLLNNLARFRNALFVLAGRPNRPLTENFKSKLREQFMVLPLRAFNEDETCAYLDAVAEQVPALHAIGLSDEQKRVIHEYTGGLPLRLALTIELLVRNLPVPQELYDSLEAARQKSPRERESVGEQIDARLVTEIMTADTLIDRALPYLALARKGMTTDLLGKLTGLPLDICIQAFEHLRQLSFVKPKVIKGEEWLFLHDEMYDVMEKYAWNRMEQERATLCEIIDQFYSECIAREAEESRQQDLMVDQLHYRFLANPKDGYASYARLADQALFRHALNLDMRLRDEMLRCYKHSHAQFHASGLTRAFVDYDSAVRWVKRYVRMGLYDSAVVVATNVQTHPERLSYQPKEWGFRLARAELCTFYGLALIYTGKIDDGVKMLETVIADLEQEPEIPQKLQPSESFEEWRYHLTLGWAHNNLGYAHWMELGHYELALAELHKALLYFQILERARARSNKQTAEPDELVGEAIANTSANLGRVYALLGNRVRAELAVRRGLALREQIGYKFRIALSLNDRAILHLAFGDPHRARQVAQKALALAENVQAQRVIGLACITLGRALRQLGAMWKVGAYGYEECDAFLADAIRFLERAVNLFTTAVNEPVRLIESKNELGCAYREQVALWQITQCDKVSQAAQRAEQNLAESVALAQTQKNDVLYVDACQDLAYLHFQSGDLENASKWLNRADDRVPAGYAIGRDADSQHAQPEPPIEEFWRQMGKIEILRGHLVFEAAINTGSKITMQKLEHAAQHYAFAATYFAHFSGRSAAQYTDFTRLYEYFNRCDTTDLLQLYPALSKIEKQYDLNHSAIRAFFDDTLGFVLQMRGQVVAP